MLISLSPVCAPKAEATEYTGVPSRPARVMVRSPVADVPAAVTRTPFRGAPSWRSSNTADQSTRIPQLAGRSGSTAMPRASSNETQEPSEPTRGQLAPPSASTAASAGISIRPSDPVNTRRPSSDHPSQRCPVRMSTPSSASRASQARTSGAPRMAAGNTRPLDPANVSAPSPSAQARRSATPNAPSAACTAPVESSTRWRRSSKVSSWVRLSPLRPASKSVRPADRRSSYTVTLAPAAASRSAANSPAGPPPTTTTCRSSAASTGPVEHVPPAARRMARTKWLGWPAGRHVRFGAPGHEGANGMGSARHGAR